MKRESIIIKELAVLDRKLKEVTNETAKEALRKKRDRLKAELKDPGQSANVLAKKLLAEREAIKQLSKVDFNDLIRRLSKKPEYAFLKTMDKGVVRNDIQRKAKPVGWRFKGRGNYDKPTMKEIVKGKKDGTVYREVRPRRSDVSFVARLEDGGPVGNIVTYQEKRYKKQPNGKWLEISKHGLTKEEHSEKINEFASKPYSWGEYSFHMANSNKLSGKEYTDKEIGLDKMKDGGGVGEFYVYGKYNEESTWEPIKRFDNKPDADKFIIEAKKSGVKLGSLPFKFDEYKTTNRKSRNWEDSEVKLMKDGGDVTGKYCVVMSGGSIGEKGVVDKKGRKLVDTFETREEAAAYAKRRNSQLSPGEKTYYKIKFYICPYNPNDFVTKMETGGGVSEIDYNGFSKEFADKLKILVTKKFTGPDGFKCNEWGLKKLETAKKRYSRIDGSNLTNRIVEEVYPITAEVVFKGINTRKRCSYPAFLSENKVDDLLAGKKVGEFQIIPEAKMATGGSLKPIPEGNKGLPKLPKAVRNKMGFMKDGGTVGEKPFVIKYMEEKGEYNDSMIRTMLEYNEEDEDLGRERLTMALYDMDYYDNKLGKDIEKHSKIAYDYIIKHNSKMKDGGPVPEGTVVFSVNNEELDNLLQDHHGTDVDYIEMYGDTYYTLNRKDFDRFLDAAKSKGFDVDYMDSQDSVIDVMSDGSSMYAKGGNVQIGDIVYPETLSGKWKVVEILDKKDSTGKVFMGGVYYDTIIENEDGKRMKYPSNRYAQGGSMYAFGGLIDENNISTGAIIRMSELVPQEAEDNMIANAQKVMSDLLNEGFEKEEVFSYIAHILVKNVKDNKALTSQKAKMVQEWSGEYSEEDISDVLNAYERMGVTFPSFFVTVQAPTPEADYRMIWKLVERLPEITTNRSLTRQDIKNITWGIVQAARQMAANRTK